MLGLEEYLSNIEVHIQVVDYIECNDKWKFQNFYPEHNKLYLICEGEGQIQVNDKIMYPREGQMALLPENEKQSLSYMSSKMFKKYYCHFNATIGTRNLFEVVDVPMIATLKDPQQLSLAMELFRNLTEVFKERSVANTLKAKGFLLQLLGLYFGHIQLKSEKVTASAATERIQKVLGFIEENIREDISVDNLADVAHLQPNYFIRFFKDQLGCTPMRYVKERKLEITKQALISTDKPISLIGQEVGFKEGAYFSRIFKENYGRSPKTYRKIYQDPHHSKVRYERETNL